METYYLYWSMAIQIWENKIQEAQFKWEGIKDRFPKVKSYDWKINK